MVSGSIKGDCALKKQIKKLVLQKETVSNLQEVWGGGGVTDFCGGTVLNDTVYHPKPSDNCTRGCPILA